MTTGFMSVFFISIGRMPFLASTLDNADPLLDLVITSGYNLLHVEGWADGKTQLVAVYESLKKS